MSIRLWFERASHLPGSRSLLRIGTAWPGGGFTGFMTFGPLEPPSLPRAEIHGDASERAIAAAGRINATPLEFRGIDWSGWVLRRQGHARDGRPENPGDREDQTSHIGPTMNAVLNRVESPSRRRIVLSYINHEVNPNDPDWVYDSLIGHLPPDCPTMVTQVMASAFPIFGGFGEIPRLKRAVKLNGRPMASNVAAQLCSEDWDFARYRGSACGSVWNSLIDSINQVIGAKLGGHLPIPSILDGGWIQTGFSTQRRATKYEAVVHGLQAEAFALLGVKDVVCFNSGGYGLHFKDPACDFAEMIAADTIAATNYSNLPRPLWRMPTEPIPFDTARFKIGRTEFDRDEAERFASR